MPYPETAFGNCNDGAMIELFGVLGNNAVKMLIDAFRAHVAQPENDDAWQFASTGGQEITKVKVMGKENASVTAGFLQYFRIAQPVETLLVKMYRLIPKILQKAYRLG
jgi:hypothetical protein